MDTIHDRWRLIGSHGRGRFLGAISSSILLLLLMGMGMRIVCVHETSRVHIRTAHHVALVVVMVVLLRGSQRSERHATQWMRTAV